MRTRTRLTTPPGQEPSLSSAGQPESEHYVPGLALPQEPRVPGRRRRLWVTLVVLAVLVVGGYIAFRVATAGQQFDPALDPQIEPGVQAPADEASQAPTEGDG